MSKSRRCKRLSEKLARKNARRSIVSSSIIRKGQRIQSEMISFKRPGDGISPALSDKVIGNFAKRDIDGDVQISWDMLETRMPE